MPNYYCHHVIGVAVMKKKAHLLDLHMEIPIGQTRGRGQPKKTASALVTQDDGLEDSSQDDDEEDPSPLKKKTVKKPVKKNDKNTQQPKKRGPKPKQKN